MIMSSNMIFNTLLLLTAVAAQPPPPQQQQEESACSWSYYQQCGWQNVNGVRTATSDSFVTFGVTSSKPNEYSATVTFFNSPFTPSSNNPNNNNGEPRQYEVISTGVQVYPTNSNITKSNTFTYTTYGYYKLGYNLTFGEGSGYCTDKTFGVEGWIYVDESSCEFGTIMEEETTTSAATAAAATVATSLGVEDIADATPVPIGKPEGAVGGNEETTTTTTTITNTDNTNNNNAAATPPLMYNNPEGNNFFCGYSFDTVSSSCLQSKPCVNGVGVGVCGDTEGCFKVDMCEAEYEVAGRVVVDTTTSTTGATATASSTTTSQPVSTTTTAEAASITSSSSTTTSASTTDMSSSTTSSAASSTSTAAPNNNEEVLVEYDEDYPWPPSADEPSSSGAANSSKNEMNFANSGDYSSADTLHCYYCRVVMIMMIGWCVVSSF